MQALQAGAAIPDCEAVLDLFAGYLATAMGAGALEALRFETDRAPLERHHRLIAEARAWLRTRGSFSFGELHDPRPLLDRAQIPAYALEAAELLAVARFLELAGELRAHVVVHGAVVQGATTPGGGSWPGLAAMGARIEDLGPLCRELRRAIQPNGELDDHASPELGRLRRQRARQRQAIETSLAQHLRKLGGEGVLQEELVTVRNERFVLPVRTDLRRRAPGVVHGASSSGQTVFVEPLETIELNNEHIRLRDAEQAEAHRILAALTAQVGAAAAAIATAADACGRLEFESAKARFAHDFQAVEVEFTPDAAPELELVEARHPVLVNSLRGNAEHRVVPLSLHLERQRTLVISGPNTGGKTVVLKTVGMAAWMAQCGLPVCAASARLPIFDALWADIGDVQSLEQNLSTFSSHLTHIRNVLEVATDRSLVLLDELGTATNAAEGAALAVEIADYLRRGAVWTLISTHHDPLKAWATLNGGAVANGSVGVHPETLRPNYQFHFGVPGMSAGLAMAERLGLPAALVAGARARLSAEEAQAGEYLERLQRSVTAAEERLAGLEARDLEISGREQALAARERTERQRELVRLRAESEKRLAAFMAAVDTGWRKLLDDLKADITNRAQRRKIELAAATFRRETGSAFQADILAELGGVGPGAELAPAVDPQPGDKVRVQSLRASGVIRRQLDDGYEVEVGHLRVRVGADDIFALPAAAAPASGVKAAGTRRALSGAQVDNSLQPVRELNLVGMRAEEAGEKLEKFLDLALLSATDQIRIVHGSGFGVLRKVVAETLRAHPQVASYHHPPQNEGGNGVTIAAMKS